TVQTSPPGVTARPLRVLPSGRIGSIGTGVHLPPLHRARPSPAAQTSSGLRAARADTRPSGERGIQVVPSHWKTARPPATQTLVGAMAATDSRIPVTGWPRLVLGPPTIVHAAPSQC